MKAAVVVLALVAVAVCQDTTSWTGPIFGQAAPAPSTEAPAPSTEAPAPSTEAPAPDTTSWTGPIFGNPPPAPTTEAPTTTTAAPTTTIPSVDPVCLKCCKYLCNGYFGFSDFIASDRKAPVCVQQLYSDTCKAIAMNAQSPIARENTRRGYVKNCVRYINEHSE